MSLLSESMESCVMMDKTTVPDGYGGFSVAYVQGALFQAAIVLENSIQARVALEEGMKSIYTITTEKTERRKDGSIVKTIIEINGNQKKTTTIITKGNVTSTNTNVEFINDEEANNCLNNFNNNNSNNDINNNFFNINGFSNNENYNNNIKKKN